MALTSLETIALEVTPEAEWRNHPWSHEELHTPQMQDSEIRPVIEKGDTRAPWDAIAPHPEATKIYWAQWNSLRLRNGVLYRLWETPQGDEVTCQLILPKPLRSDVLHQLHNTLTAGHLAVAKTLNRVRERFYWARYHGDVRDWC